MHPSISLLALQVKILTGALAILITASCGKPRVADMTLSVGSLTIKHWEGDLVYGLAVAKLRITNGMLGIQIISDNPDESHKMAALGPPMFTAWLPCAIPISELRGKSFAIPNQDRMNPNPETYSSLYVSSHHDCFDTTIEFSGSGSISIRSMCEDINYYDQRARDNELSFKVTKFIESEDVHSIY
jgi:hypothetical protein